MDHTYIVWGIELKDLLTIIAILLAPITTLWIQKYLDDRKNANNQRLNIFKTLMATRASVLSFEHIKALNMIDVEFYGAKKYREVRRAWRSYLQVRNNQPQVTTELQSLQFNKECSSTLTALLIKMSEALGYDFDEAHISQSIYKPQAHITEEQYQLFIRGKLFEFFSGKISLPMDVKSMPGSLEDLQEQKKLRELAIMFLEEKLHNKDSNNI